MEEHPVPQNVTDFEFHLVGDMTLKQFGYLAGGCVIAYIIFLLFNKSAPYIAYPLILFFVLTGTAFAFLPIQSRPLDHWLVAFLTAIFQPTQRVYQSKLMKIEDPFFKKRLNIYLSYLHPEDIPIFQPAPNTQAPFVPVGKSIPQSSAQPAPQPQQPLKPTEPPPTNQPKSLPASSELRETVSLAKEVQDIQTEIIQAEKQIQEIKAQAAQPGSNPQDFTNKFQKTLTSLEHLNDEAKQVSSKLAQVTKTLPPSVDMNHTVKARIMPTVTLTSIENILNGIVADSQGNYIEGAIVVAHDKQSLPVRALKSNKLGQFIAATPLPSGIYTLTVEKENMFFDVIEVEIKGDVLKPILVQAKRKDLLSS